MFENMGRGGGGLVASVLAFNVIVHSSNTADAYCFFLLNLV